MRIRPLIALALAAMAAVTAAGPATASDATLDLDRYRGQVVVLDFWASWCTPCRRSFPWLDAMQQKYAEDGLVVVGVNVDTEPADAAAFLDDVPVSFRIVEDRKGELAARYELMAMPSSFVIGRDGRLFTRHLGFRVAQQDEYEDLLRQALGIDTADPVVAGGH